MAKALLINPPSPSSLYYLGDSAAVPTRIAYLGGLLRQGNIDYTVLDLNILSIEKYGITKHNSYASSPNENINYRLWMEELIAKETIKSNYVALNTDMNYDYLQFLKAARLGNENIKCIVGGKRASANPNFYAKDGYTDIICQGFGDTFADVVKGKTHKMTKIKLKNRTVTLTPYRTKTNGLITPDYSMIELNQYFKHFSYVNLIGSLGCRYRCRFCSRIKDDYTPKNVSHILDEIKFFNERYQIRNFMFLDSSINCDGKHLDHFLSSLKKEKLDIKWQAMFRPDNLSIKIIPQLKQTGLFFGAFGIETPVKRLQKILNKQQDTKHAQNVIMKFRASQIKTLSFLMYDIPRETIKDYWEALRFMKQSKVDYSHLNRLEVFPGTIFFSDAAKYFNKFKRDDFSLKQSLELTRHITMLIKKGLSELTNRYYLNKLYNDQDYMNFIYKRTYQNKILGKI